jgi:hypothetical protein
MRTLAVLSWAFPLFGVALLAVSYYSHALYDLLVGGVFAVFGSIGATLMTIAMSNALAEERNHERQAHPSYPFRNR